MVEYTIAVTSDAVCPWCYVGQKQLHKAIALLPPANPPHKFNIIWSPFYLNPQAPFYPGISKPLYLASRFGSARVAQIHARLESIGSPLGIRFKHNGHTGNSRDAHIVIHCVGVLEHGDRHESDEEKEKRRKEVEELWGGNGIQDRVMSRIFRWVNEEEGNVTDKKGLVEVTSKALMDSRKRRFKAATFPPTPTALLIKPITPRTTSPTALDNLLPAPQTLGIREQVTVDLAVNAAIKATVVEEKLAIAAAAAAAKEEAAAVHVNTAADEAEQAELEEIKDLVWTWFNDKSLARKIDELAEEGIEDGSDGVPRFLFNGRHVLTGARDAEEFFELFRKIATEEKRGIKGPQTENGIPIPGSVENAVKC
ncbi:hypothetical protein DFH27DRAFT_74626 [Peziza echinospora]|nr:hypothetical protein DFH27DRAFT_74626 [Peziza echinospora]